MKHLPIVKEIFLPLVDCPVGGFGEEGGAGHVLPLVCVLGRAVRMLTKAKTKTENIPGKSS